MNDPNLLIRDLEQETKSLARTSSMILGGPGLRDIGGTNNAAEHRTAERSHCHRQRKGE